MMWLGIAIGFPLGMAFLVGWYCLSLHFSLLRNTMANPPWYARIRI